MDGIFLFSSIKPKFNHESMWPEIKGGLKVKPCPGSIETMAGTGRTLPNLDGVEANFVHRTVFVLDFWCFKM